jgi:hypothetical protein
VLAHELSHTIYEHTLNQVQQNAMIAARESTCLLLPHAAFQLGYMRF